ncbi:hypothetical protein [Nonomuraea diastatica]|uniref:Uncharacterized protein n=1 Tax=Nonomuraea diastatica TaxID=1848329 RepID=A0A4R4WVG3_9ACTN|nr:hypothetical protein [Nonomuraea diastatica]TDD21618.1 hypothetical protein E1294_14395 [Nonomuraea diastatica]
MNESLPSVLAGEPLTAIPTHRAESSTPIAGDDIAAATLRRIADALAAEHYSYGDGTFFDEEIQPIQEIVRRLGITDWQPRHPDEIVSP